MQARRRSRVSPPGSATPGDATTTVTVAPSPECTRTGVASSRPFAFSTHMAPVGWRIIHARSSASDMTPGPLPRSSDIAVPRLQDPELVRCRHRHLDDRAPPVEQAIANLSEHRLGNTLVPKSAEEELEVGGRRSPDDGLTLSHTPTNAGALLVDHRDTRVAVAGEVAHLGRLRVA